MKRLVPVVITLIVAGCASAPKGPVVDPTLSQLASSARAAYDRGSLPQAISFYERALQRARLVDDGAEIARNAYNLSACLLAAGEPQRARATLVEAKAEFARQGMSTHAAILLEIEAARALQDKDAAAKGLEESFAVASTDGERFASWIAKGRIACDEQDVVTAKKALGKAKSLAGSSAGESAALAALAANIHRLSGEFLDAARSADQAADAYREAARYREMSDVTADAAELYVAGKDDKAAAERFHRAARSFLAQGNTVEALRLIDQGLAAADRAGDESARALLKVLFEEVEGQVERAKATATP